MRYTPYASPLSPFDISRMLRVTCYPLPISCQITWCMWHITDCAKIFQVTHPLSSLPITSYISHITCHVTLWRIYEIAYYISHLTYHIVHITYHIWHILDFISLVYDPFISHVGYHVSHCCEIYTFVSPWSPLDTYLISDVAYHMSSLAYYMSDNLMHITYTDCIKIFQVTHHLSSLPITSYISHITCHYHILHI